MEVKKPSRKFTIKVNGEDQDIVMSYGLFNEISKVIPSPEQVPQLLVTDAMLRDYVVRRVLTGNKHVKSDEDLIDPFTLDIDPDDLEDLVAWVADHVMSFFISSAAKANTVLTKYKGPTQDLTALATQSNQLQAGSEN